MSRIFTYLRLNPDVEVLKDVDGSEDNDCYELEPYDRKKTIGSYSVLGGTFGTQKIQDTFLAYAEAMGYKPLTTGEDVYFRKPFDVFSIIKSIKHDVELPTFLKKDYNPGSNSIIKENVPVKPIKKVSFVKVSTEETKTSTECVSDKPVGVFLSDATNKYQSADIKEALEFVDENSPYNLNTLPKNCSINVFRYGYEEGEKAFKTMSAGAMRELFRRLPQDTRFEPSVMVITIAEMIRKEINVKVSDRQAMLLAASRIVAWKSNIDFGKDGWAKI